MNTIVVTDAAWTAVERFTKDANLNKDDASGVRVGVAGGGCAGFSYKIGFSNEKSDDFKLEKNGCFVYVDKESMLYLDGSEIDFVDDSLAGKAGFKIKNPNAAHSCGCGDSFGV